MRAFLMFSSLPVCMMWLLTVTKPPLYNHTELGVKTRQDLLKIPPGKDGRKYLHDDITVSVVTFGTAGTVQPFTSTTLVSGDGVAAAATPTGRARGRWGEIKKSVDLIKMMNGKGKSRWYDLIR